MVRKTLAALCVLLLGSCGGGGGGDSPAPGSNFRVSFDRSSVSFEQYEGSGAQPQTITATATGDPGGTVFVSVTIEGDHIDPSGVSLTFSGTQAFVSVAPRADLAPGTYTGRLVIEACPDQQCSRHFTGTPFSVTTSSVVRRGLRLDPPQVSLTVPSGQPTSTRVNVQPTEGFPFTAELTFNTPWLSMENVDATGFTLVTIPLPGGSYSQQVRVTSGPITKLLNVPLTVSPAPNEHDLQVSVSGLALAAAATTSVSQDITVVPPTWTSAISNGVTYFGNTSGWLSAVPIGNNVWRITASAVALGPGNYSATIAFRSNYPSVPREVGVNLTVVSGLTLPSEFSTTATSESTQATLTERLPVNTVGNVPFTWTASTTTPWLRLDNASGNAGAELVYHFDAAGVAPLQNFAEHTGTIAVTTSLPNFAAHTLTVRLTKRLAEVHAVGPHVVVRGRSSRVIVQGRGFGDLFNPSTRLLVGNVTPDSVVRVGDNQLQVQLPAMAQPSLPVSVSNGLGIDTGSFTLKTAAQTGYQYAGLDVAGFVRTLTYDPERRTLYVVRRSATSPTRNSLTRITFNGTGWNSAPLIADDLYDVALGPDGSALLAVMLAGELRWLDPLSGAALRQALPLGQAFTDDREFFLGQGLPVTLDGRLLLPLDITAGNPFKNLTQVDLRSDAITPRNDVSSQYTFYRGPLFVASRDRNSLMGRQNSGLSGVDSIYDAVRHNAGSGAFFRAPSIRAPFDMRFSDDGEWTVIDLDRFVNRFDEQYGLVRLPASHRANWVVVSAQIRSDGQRIYVLAYPNLGNQESSTSGMKPRVYVLNSSSFAAAELPVMGYFEIDDYPSTCIAAGGTCWQGLASAISPDDFTLFYSGALRTLVIPIQGTLLPISSSAKPSGRWVVPKAQ